MWSFKRAIPVKVITSSGLHKCKAKHFRQDSLHNVPGWMWLFYFILRAHPWIHTFITILQSCHFKNNVAIYKDNATLNVIIFYQEEKIGGVLIYGETILSAQELNIYFHNLSWTEKKLNLWACPGADSNFTHDLSSSKWKKPALLNKCICGLNFRFSLLYLSPIVDEF